MFFVGAPAASSITSESCTLTQFEKPLAKFLGLPQQESSLSSASSSSYATWRSLPLKRQQLHTGFSQRHEVSDDFLEHRTEFFTTADVSLNEQTTGSFAANDDGQALLSQFCEHSLAIHNSIPSSQLDSFEQTSALEETDTSFVTTTTTSSSGNIQDGSMAPPPLPAHLSDLEDIPSAPRIVALNPQTVTLNLIVGVISIAQPRTITTRWGRTLTLLEILVGDETRSGFAVTFWVDQKIASEAQVTRLRRQDVVLMQNVALHEFRGKVYGQSLRRGMTKVSVLWRRDGTGYYSARDLARRGQKHPQQEKTRQVKDWVLRFVGGDKATRSSKRARKSWDRPPDDTQ